MMLVDSEAQLAIKECGVHQRQCDSDAEGIKPKRPTCGNPDTRNKIEKRRWISDAVSGETSRIGKRYVYEGERSETGPDDNRFISQASVVWRRSSSWATAKSSLHRPFFLPISTPPLCSTLITASTSYLISPPSYLIAIFIPLISSLTLSRYNFTNSRHISPAIMQAAQRSWGS